MTTRFTSGGPGLWSRALATLGFTAVAAIGLVSTPARADTMDPTPERLITQPTFNGKNLPAGVTCQGLAANPLLALKIPGVTKSNLGSALTQLSCLPNNLAFQNLVSELGFAIAPTAFHPARTTGFGGFAFTFEADYTHVNANATAGGLQYWHLGTQGSTDPNTGLQSQANTSPDSLLQVYSLKMRKGFPLGFEIVGDIGYIPNTVMWVAGADVRWALMEGFRSGWPSYLPDVSVGGGVRTLTGTSKFSLTTVGIDAQVSHPFTLADTSVLTPYVGYQQLYIFGDSSTVDLTPNTDPLAACGYTGTNPSTGQPSCANRISGTPFPNSADFNNDTTFASVRTVRNRGIVGLNYRYELLYLAGQVLFDLTAPNVNNPGLNGAYQWTMSFEAGVFF